MREVITGHLQLQLPHNSDSFQKYERDINAKADSFTFSHATRASAQYHSAYSGKHYQGLIDRKVLKLTIIGYVMFSGD